MNNSIFETKDAEKIIRKYYEETSESCKKKIKSIEETSLDYWTTNGNKDCDRHLIVDKASEYLFISTYYPRGIEHEYKINIRVNLIFVRCNSKLITHNFKCCEHCDKEFLFVDIELNKKQRFFRVCLENK